MVQRRNWKQSARCVATRSNLTSGQLQSWGGSQDVLKPVMKSLYPLGLNSSELDQRCKRRLNVRIIVCLIAAHLVVVHTLSNSFYYAFKKRQLSVAFGNLAGFLRALTSAITLDYFLLKKASIYGCIRGVNNLRYYYSKRGSHCKVPGKNFCLVSVVIFWLFYITKVGLPLIFAKYLEPKFYIEMFLYDLPFLRNLNEDGQRFACCFELFLYQCIVGMKHFGQLVVTCAVAVTTRKVNYLMEALRNDNLVDPRVLSVWHSDLFGLVRKMDKHFRFLYFVWMCEWMTSLILNLPKLLTNLKSDNVLANVLSYMDIVSTLFVSIVVSVAISEVSCKQEGLLSAIHHRVSSRGRGTSNRKSQLIDSYLLIKIDTANLRMTIFECIIVTKTFIISLYGAVLTYVIFIAQELQKEAF